ncbi:FAD-binding oxidoreductase [Pontibacter sp. CAU 1760]
MKEYNVKTIDGGTKQLSSEALNQFSDKLRGEVVTPDASNYDEVRAIWNSMIDKRPSLIVQCAGTADVQQAVQLAAEHRLLVSVRGAGHNIAGSALTEGGLMIDLKPMKGIRIDPENRTARVQPGCTLGDFDQEAQAFGLATPIGVSSTTGIAGLTLGGGFGWISRKYGMTIDNLLSADLVTADGKLLHTNEQQHPDLFWAIRGGGGNFGIVTSFEFKLHPVGPEVLSGLLIYPFEETKKVLDYYRAFSAKLSNESTVWAITRYAPPLPFLPEQWHGKLVIILAAFHTGNMQEGEKVFKPLREFMRPIVDVIGPHPFIKWQQAFDPLLTPGSRNYWKSHNFESLSDEVIEQLIAFSKKLPSSQTEIFIGQVGGKMNEVAPDATAYPHRTANYVMNVHTRWDDAAQDDACILWARDFYEATAPYATGGVYVNFMTQDDASRIGSAYGPNYDRLVHIKSKYDPQNLFRSNQNIKPLAMA